MSNLKTEYCDAKPLLRIVSKRKLQFINRVAAHPFFDWLNTGREDVLRLRKRARKELGLQAIVLLPRFELANYGRMVKQKLYLHSEEPIPIRAFTRAEKISVLGALALISSCAAVTGNGSPVEARAYPAPTQVEVQKNYSPKPVNWLTGKSNKKGSKKAVASAYNYAKVAGYTFAANKSEVEKLVEVGELVRLNSKYIRLVDVAEPYALPLTAIFIDRLGKQYASRGCGKLVVTSAMRPAEHQGTLSNGSSLSVHPTGMSIDLRRAIPSSKQESFCLEKLEELLEDIEKDRRIDVTIEENPRHFHVVVVPDAYETWLSSLKPGLDPEVEAMAKALFFEGAFNETEEGYQAIAAVIKNRVRSSEYPNTIVEVVAEGAAARSSGGCQFSFMCDGKKEHMQLLCKADSKVRKEFWEDLCKERWEKVVTLAERYIADETDPTNGAVLYYAKSMRKAPYWAGIDMKRGTIKTIDSHVFACSVNRGKDVCKGASS